MSSLGHAHIKKIINKRGPTMFAEFYNIFGSWQVAPAFLNTAKMNVP